MKIMLLHLSDIHLRDANDSVLLRIPKIADAVRNLDADIRACVVTVTGDLVHSGTEDQFLLVAEALDKLRSQLKAYLGSDVATHVVVLPGNHDCDFANTLEARERLVESLESKLPDDPDNSIIAVCTEPQNAFFGARDLVSDSLVPSGGRLFYSYVLDVGNRRVVLNCCNTAWVSRLREQQGRLFFPLGPLPNARPVADLSVMMCHHTYAWLNTTNARAFQHRIESIADIVLTGHEHDLRTRFQRGTEGESNIYVEGAALQEAGSEESAFTALLFDLEERKQRLIPFKWDGDLFARPRRDRGWEAYELTKARELKLFDISAEMRQKLQDLGVLLEHPAKGTLKLTDIFVFPDFREVRYDQRPSGKAVRGERLVHDLRDHPHLLITGSDQCGKSVFSKVLFQQLRATGVIPLLVRGQDVDLRSLGELEKYLEDLFCTQYSAGHLEQFRQIERSRRAIILDGYDRLQIKGKPKRAVLSRLRKFAGIVVLFGSDLPMHVSEFTGTESGTLREGAFRHYAMQVFGHVRRNELTEKWLSLDPKAADDPAALSRSIIALKRMMDIALGRNYVPAFPVFLLAILQAHEHSQPVDITASTYGYFYELLIRQALAGVGRQQDFDIWLHYLAHVAHVMFVRGETRLDEQVLMAAHQEFERARLIKLEFLGIMSQLLKRQVIERRDGGYEFKYSYIRYYFIASYLRDHIDQQSSRDAIVSLTSELHQEENANILVFLAHLSKSSFIIEQMLAAGERAFPDAAPQDLRKPVLPTSTEVQKAIGTIALVERPIGESRTEEFERLDAIEEQREGSNGVVSQVAGDGDELAPVVRYLARLGAAFKAMQILGQVLKNFPGGLEGEYKMRLARACRDIGLRTMGSVVGLMQANQHNFVQEVVERLRDEYPSIDPKALEKEVQANLFGMMHLVTYGIVRRVAVAIGSPHLSEVYDKLDAETPSPFMTLVRTALRLDHGKGFPVTAVVSANGELAASLLGGTALKRMVVHHFYLFDEPITVRQQVCAKLGIPIRRAISVEPRMKLLSSGPSAEE